MAAPELCDCHGLKRPHVPGVRWCHRPRPAAPEDASGPLRPRVVIEKAADAATWHVRLAEAWGRAHRGSLVGLVRRKDATTWLGRHYVAFSPAPSLPVPPAPSRSAAAELVADAWAAQL